jgi:hypothetical protein
MANGRAKDVVEKLCLQFSQMKAEREPWAAVWRKIAVFESERGNMFHGTQAQDASYLALYRNTKDIDNTARNAIQVFSSGMLSGVTPASDQWFRLRVSDASGGKDLQQYRPVAHYLEQLEQVFLKDFVTKNFYTQQVSSYKQIGMYGMQCMNVGFHEDLGTYYRDIPVDEIYVTNDFAGRVNCVFREMFLSIQQAVEMFGQENMSDGVKKMIRMKQFNPNERIRIIHAVYKKSPGFENVLGNNKLPYVSFYFEPAEEHLISEGGFESMPYIVTRAYADGRSPYSVSPGTVALADVLMVNEIKSLMLQAGQLSIAPPMLMPDNGLVGRLSYRPSAINLYRKDATSSPNDYMPLKLGGDFTLAMELMNMAQKDIQTAFFVDLFLMIHNRVQGGQGTPTATEIQQLATEKSFLLAPILINQQQENFNRLFERVFELMQGQDGKLPPVPEELQDAELEIHYESPLVRAQQGVQTQQMLQAMQDMGALMQIYPDLKDIMDSDMMMRKILDNRGMPQSLIREVKEVMELRQGRQEAQMQAQQQMQQQAEAQAMMGAYQGLSQAPQPGSPAQALMQGSGLA